MNTSNNSVPPPPDGYESWIEYALDEAFEFGPASKSDICENARQELAELRARCESAERENTFLKTALRMEPQPEKSDVIVCYRNGFKS